MKAKTITLALVFVLVNIFGHTQVRFANGLYTVDKRIDLQLKKFVLVDPVRLKNSMKIRVPWNDRRMFDQSLDCFTKSYIRNDTIYITGYMVGELGYGFGLMLFRDSCIVFPYGLSDGKIYKYNESDTTYIDFIPLPSRTYKVVLSKIPSFKEGETVEGFVELNSYPFYYRGLEGIFKIELQAYFKTGLIKKIE